MLNNVEHLEVDLMIAHSGLSAADRDALYITACAMNAKWWDEATQ
jgi:hypothetical protein